MKRSILYPLIFVLFSLVVFIGCEKEEPEPAKEPGVGGVINYGSFTDSRDNSRTYKTVIINGKEWMAENLAYLPRVSPLIARSKTSPIYYVYGYSGTDVGTAKQQDNYTKYGVLYNWPAALIACPSGWHLPNDDEWDQLAQYISDQKGPYSKTMVTWDEVGKHLKAKSGWYNNGNGTDDFGFSGLPGGRRDRDGSFKSIGSWGS